ncbi:hypothetical protein BSKO_13316 [Bryopsis sp. KO-2023]|nr:hypothetical protein BSKO_13316 [Bryopsis sp. KO-2023]
MPWVESKHGTFDRSAHLLETAIVFSPLSHRNAGFFGSISNTEGCTPPLAVCLVAQAELGNDGKIRSFMTDVEQVASRLEGLLSWYDESQNEMDKPTGPDGGGGLVQFSSNRQDMAPNLCEELEDVSIWMDNCRATLEVKPADLKDEARMGRKGNKSQKNDGDESDQQPGSPAVQDNNNGGATVVNIIKMGRSSTDESLKSSDDSIGEENGDKSPQRGTYSGGPESPANKSRVPSAGRGGSSTVPEARQSASPASRSTRSPKSKHQSSPLGSSNTVSQQDYADMAKEVKRLKRELAAAQKGGVSKKGLASKTSPTTQALGSRSGERPSHATSSEDESYDHDSSPTTEARAKANPSKRGKGATRNENRPPGSLHQEEDEASNASDGSEEEDGGDSSEEEGAINGDGVEGAKHGKSSSAGPSAARRSDGDGKSSKSQKSPKSKSSKASKNEKESKSKEPKQSKSKKTSKEAAKTPRKKNAGSEKAASHEELKSKDRNAQELSEGMYEQKAAFPETSGGSGDTELFELRQLIRQKEIQIEKLIELNKQLMSDREEIVSEMQAFGAIVDGVNLHDEHGGDSGRSYTPTQTKREGIYHTCPDSLTIMMDPVAARKMGGMAATPPLANVISDKHGDVIVTRRRSSSNSQTIEPARHRDANSPRTFPRKSSHVDPQGAVQSTRKAEEDSPRSEDSFRQSYGGYSGRQGSPHRDRTPQGAEDGEGGEGVEYTGGSKSRVRQRDSSSRAPARRKERSSDEFVCPTCAQLKRQLRWWRARGWLEKHNAKKEKKGETKTAKENVFLNTDASFYGLTPGVTDAAQPLSKRFDIMGVNMVKQPTMPEQGFTVSIDSPQLTVDELMEANAQHHSDDIVSYDSL